VEASAEQQQRKVKTKPVAQPTIEPEGLSATIEAAHNRHGTTLRERQKLFELVTAEMA
jgi:hypothetical protein